MPYQGLLIFLPQKNAISAAEAAMLQAIIGRKRWTSIK